MGLMYSYNTRLNLINDQNKDQGDTMKLQAQARAEQDTLTNISLENTNLDKEDLSSVQDPRTAGLQLLDKQIQTVLQNRDIDGKAANEENNGNVAQGIEQGRKNIFGIGGQQQ